MHLVLVAFAAIVPTTCGINIVSRPPDQLYLLPSQPTFKASGGTNITAPYISYDPSFEQLIVSDPALVANGSFGFAYEAGAWDPDRNEIWFTSLLQLPPKLSYPSILHLSNNSVTRPKLIDSSGASVTLIQPNGGYYFNGSIYFTIAGSGPTEGAVVMIDPDTYVVTTVLNSYYGLALNSVDDLAWVYPPTAPSFDEAHLFFSTLDFGFDGFNLTTPVLPNACYRFTPSTQALVAVIPRDEVLNPNGIATDRAFNYLYVTDFSVTAVVGAAELSSGSSAVYRYDLGADYWPQSRRMLALIPEGGADGLKVDDAGRIWTAEGLGVVVRDPLGKTLGIFNAAYFGQPTLSVAQFALAGDILVILSIDKIYTVQLSEVVLAPTRFLPIT